MWKRTVILFLVCMVSVLSVWAISPEVPMAVTDLVWKVEESKENPLHPKIREALPRPVTLVFDPFSAQGERYTALLRPVGSSVISPSWFELTADGVSRAEQSSAEYVRYYQGIGFHVWPLITNQFDPDLTRRILQDKSKWSRYAEDLLMYGKEYNIDGYNFDFENIYYEDKEVLTAFVTFLSTSLQAHGLYVSMDVTGYSESRRWSLVYDRKSLAAAVDFLVLMAYDQTPAGSRVAGPVASYPWVKRNVAKLIDEVPQEKVILGIPFYMRIWESYQVQSGVYDEHLTLTSQRRFDLKEKSAGNRLKISFADYANLPWRDVYSYDKAKTLTITDSLRYREAYAAQLQWDEELKLFYLRFASEGYKYQIWFEDETSLTYKLELARDYRLAGVGAWRKGFESNEMLSVLYNG